MNDLAALVSQLRASRGFAHKVDIAGVLERLGGSVAPADATLVPNGDDCAVLRAPGGHGHLLLAIEGLVHEFVEGMPWFAGYSGVMVNLSDVAAMGGRPLAVVDALWSGDEAQAAELLAGMRAAAERYAVPLVGGHTNLRAQRGQLAVAVLGHGMGLISSFAAQPEDRLLMAVDLRGRWMEPYPFWNASTDAPAVRLRADLAVLPELAETGLCDAGKDISMAGLLGTTLMLLESSGVGARVALERVPAPESAREDAASWMRWLTAFPSYGYVLSVRPSRADAIVARFVERGIACADIGEVTHGAALLLSNGSDAEAVLWDWSAEPFIGSGAKH